MRLLARSTALFLSLNGPIAVPAQAPCPAQLFLELLQEFIPLQEFFPAHD